MSLDENAETYDTGTISGGGFGAGEGTQAVIDTALASAEPAELDPEVRFTVHAVPAGGGVAVIDQEVLLERFRAVPRRKGSAGEYHVHDAASFAAYFLKHADDHTEVWADVTSTRITAVLDAHAAAPGVPAEDGWTGARWEQHRVVYDARPTEEWKAWTAQDGKIVAQDQFTAFIEQRLLDIREPASADMLEIVQTIEQNSSVNFRSSKLIANGQRQIEFREVVEGGAGRDGQFEIPKELVLAIRPFEGSDAFKVTAAFRTRIVNSSLMLGYQLIRPRDIEREAFTSVVQAIQGQVSDHGMSTPILMGKAPVAGDSTITPEPFAFLAFGT